MRPQADRDRGKRRPVPRPKPFSRAQQEERFTPAFNRLSQVLQRDPSGLELKADAAALAPERLLVFELRGTVNAFAAAVQRVQGLELVDEEELEQEGEDKAPVAYLMVPDVRALKDIESLWRRWLAGQLVAGETPWRDVFATLRNLRPWGPADRVHDEDAALLANEIDGLADADRIRLEAELVYRSNANVRQAQAEAVQREVTRLGGRTLSSATLPDIAYQALLVELPVLAVRQIVEKSANGLAGLEQVIHIRPQSVASGIEIEDTSQGEEIAAGQDRPALGEPILALIDGVPIAGHPLLGPHLTIDDQFGMEPITPVDHRRHGSAMASILVHGDRGRPGIPLPRKIHVVPVLGPNDEFPADRLVVDIIYSAIVNMKSGAEATGRGIVIVNVSLGNDKRPFHGQLSAWARLLDRLAYQFGILFVVSAGNCRTPFTIPSYQASVEFEAAEADARSTETLKAVAAIMGERRMLSPAETINGITVGALNDDSVSAAGRAGRVFPYDSFDMANPSSGLGPGFALSVKPDILMAGGRERLQMIESNPLRMRPAFPSRFGGVKVAAPPSNGVENAESFTLGTSPAAALASRTCHQIHDALEAEYGEEFLRLSTLYRAVLLKALLVHPARWPSTTANWIKTTVGPADARQFVRQRDNIRRFLGFGVVNADDAVACAADRATFWATGALEGDKVATVDIPVPVTMGGKAQPHSLSATLAWFSPTSPGRRSYRSTRLKILEPAELGALRVTPLSTQPDTNQTNRGTVFNRCWFGDKAPIIGENHTIQLSVQRDPDRGGVVIDDSIPFGLAVTIAMPGVIEIYDQVRQRLRIPERAPA